MARTTHLAIGVVLAIVTSVLTMLGGYEVAHACSCSAPGDLGGLQRSDLVFIGTVLPQTEAELATQYPNAVDSEGRPDAFANRILRFRVERVFKGSVPAIQDVVTEGQGSACGLILEIGVRYLVFGGSSSPVFGPPMEPGQYSAHFCSGVRPAELHERPPGFPRSTTPRSTPDRDVPAIKPGDPKPCRTIKTAEVERIFETSVRRVRQEHSCKWIADTFSVSYYPLDLIRGMGRDLIAARRAVLSGPLRDVSIGSEAYLVSYYREQVSLDVRDGDFVFAITVEGGERPDTHTAYDVPIDSEARVTTLARLVLRNR